MKQKGFTLIEIIFAMIILAVVVLSVMTVLANVNQATAMPDVINRCTYLAERELERVNQRRFSMVVNEGPVNYAMAGYTDYSYQIAVSPPPAALGLGTTTARAKQVIVTVSHPVHGQVQLTTLVGNN